MDSILNLLANGDNVRLLVILAVGYVGYMRINSRMDRLEYSLNKRIDGVEFSLNKKIDELRGELKGEINELRGELKGEIKELKYNDFAHLSSAFEALTFTLEKNGSLSKEDKDYIIGRLATV